MTTSLFDTVPQGLPDNLARRLLALARIGAGTEMLSAKERQRDSNGPRKETTASAPDVETVQLDLL